MFLATIAAVAVSYLLFTLLCTYLVQALPRRPIVDPPDWGTVTDTRVMIGDGGSLEVWRVEPDGPSRGIVLLAHGWGRNRDRMVNRARMFGQMGFTTVIHSARDHGNSSRRWVMNAYRFAEDIETIMNWIGEPVILYGHSAGEGGAIIAASRNPDRIRLLFLEACYAVTDEALLSLYRWVNRFFGTFIGPMIILWMKVFYRNRLKDVDPIVLAPGIKARTLIIHGEKDKRFPVEFAHRLHAHFPGGQSRLHVARGVGHSDSSLTAGYPDAVKAFLDQHLEP